MQDTTQDIGALDFFMGGCEGKEEEEEREIVGYLDLLQEGNRYNVAKSYKLYMGENKIGRSQIKGVNDVVLDKSGVSLEHACIDIGEASAVLNCSPHRVGRMVLDLNSIYVQDNDSRNKTAITDKRNPTSAELKPIKSKRDIAIKHGQILIFGNVFCQFRIVGLPDVHDKDMLAKKDVKSEIPEDMTQDIGFLGSVKMEDLDNEREEEEGDVDDAGAGKAMSVVLEGQEGGSETQATSRGGSMGTVKLSPTSSSHSVSYGSSVFEGGGTAGTLVLGTAGTLVLGNDGVEEDVNATFMQQEEDENTHADAEHHEESLSGDETDDGKYGMVFPLYA